MPLLVPCAEGAKMGKKCAYCDSLESKLTREHIWPSSLGERVKSYSLRYSERAEKVFQGDLVIQDVCERCNNGPLSKLDEYLVELYDRSFHRFCRHHDQVEFYYDWGLLCRALMKLSYNSARGSKSNHQVMKRYRSQILGSDSITPDVLIFLDLVEPSYVGDGADEGLIVMKKIDPGAFRLCRVEGSGLRDCDFIVRLVALNSFYFYLVVPEGGPGSISRLNKFLSFIQSFSKRMALISPDSSFARVSTAGTGTGHILAPHLLEKKDLYRAALNENGKRTKKS